jgi:flagellar basal-body rod modification protein FlgD
MSIAALNSVTDNTAGSAAAKPNALDKDAFLNLLIAQLQNQDPLNPTDSVEFTAQLAQFSSLEQLGNVNDNLKQLQDVQQAMNNSQAVSLIGKEILAQGNSLQRSDGQPVDCSFSLDQDAAVAAVTIYDSTGDFVKSIEANNLAQGTHTLVWDGTDQNGNPAPNGSYTFEVQAADADGRDIGAATFFSATVDGVSFENNKTLLVCDSQKVALSDLIEVTAPSSATSTSQQSLPNSMSITNGGH